MYRFRNWVGLLPYLVNVANGRSSVPNQERFLVKDNLRLEAEDLQIKKLEKIAFWILERYQIDKYHVWYFVRFDCWNSHRLKV